MGQSQNPNLDLSQKIAELRRLAALLEAAQAIVYHVLSSEGRAPALETPDPLHPSIDQNLFATIVTEDKARASPRAALHPGVPLDQRDTAQIERQRRIDIFAQYESLREYFTSSQWAVICPYYRDGQSEQEIAEAWFSGIVQGLLLVGAERS